MCKSFQKKKKKNKLNKVQKKKNLIKCTHENCKYTSDRNGNIERHMNAKHRNNEKNNAPLLQRLDRIERMLIYAGFSNETF